MSYSRQTFEDNKTKLKAEHLDKMQDAILDNEKAIASKQGALISGTNIKTINGQSLLGSGNIVIEGSETSSETLPDSFEFYSQSATATLVNNENGSVTITDAGATAIKYYAAFTSVETGRYSMTVQATSITSNSSFLLLCYKKNTNVYGVRCEGTTIKLQRFDYTTWSGAAAITDTLDASFSYKSGDKLEFLWAKGILEFYCNDNLIHSFDATSINDGTGENIGGLVCLNFTASAATKGETPFVDMVILDNEIEQNIEIDEALDANSLNPVTNKAITQKFNEIEAATVDTRVKYSHFSIDDFYLAFEDLTNNTPASIFDNTMFAWLKTFHETTGCTISCYCFYQNAASNPTFTLDMVPTTWRNEFKANSSWLKFGFHALYQGINYASATAEKATEDYSKAIAALINITGSADCIDRMPRLHNFAGSLEACKAMRDAQCGCCGFLAAINASDGGVRQSYYLAEEPNVYINKHDYYYDATTQLHFVRTQEGGNLYNTGSYNTDIKYANVNKFVEFFTHENQLTDGIKSAFVAGYNRLKTTHKPVFWQDIFN